MIPRVTHTQTHTRDKITYEYRLNKPKSKIAWVDQVTSAGLKDLQQPITSKSGRQLKYIKMLTTILQDIAGT